MPSNPISPLGLYINGSFRGSASRRTFETINPATEEVLAEVAEAGEVEVDDAVKAARDAFDHGPWPRMPVSRRSQFLYDVASHIEARAAELARMEAADTGMTLKMTTEGHIPRAIAHFRFFAEQAEHNVGEYYPLDDAYMYIVERVPVGVVAIFAPWNAPLAVASMHLAAALAYGNCCVLKPSEKSPLSAQVLAEIVHEIGMPAGVVNLIQGGAEPTGRLLARHPQKNMISFVGGTDAGRSVMQAASSHLARIGMELGGKSPAIVFADADLDSAVDGVLLAALSSNGEVCTAASRVLVEGSVYHAVVNHLVARATNIKLGSPLLPDTEMGPLISSEHRSMIGRKVQAAVAMGATLLCGGMQFAEAGRGYYFLPTILANVPTCADIAREELFGPVVIVQPFDSEQEVIKVANDTPYGLAAYIWSGNGERALRVARKLRVGTVAINSVVVRDLRVPFGGFAQSGIGRIGGTYSRDLFTEVKTTCIPLEPYSLPRLGAHSERA